MITKLTIGLILALLVCIIPVSDATAQVANTETKQSADHRLSEAQLKSIKVIRTRAAKLAAPLAIHLVVTTRRVYENMLREKEDAMLRSRLSTEMHNIAGELLTIKGQSIREVLHVLTRDQKKLLKSEMGRADAPADLMELIERTFNIPEK